MGTGGQKDVPILMMPSKLVGIHQVIIKICVGEG
jgi:hypothetical protein